MFLLALEVHIYGSAGQCVYGPHEPYIPLRDAPLPSTQRLRLRSRTQGVGLRGESQLGRETSILNYGSLLVIKFKPDV